MKFVCPLYADLHASKLGKSFGTALFKKESVFYHPICAKMIGSKLGLELVDGVWA
jgi:hypothetical protein